MQGQWGGGEPSRRRGLWEPGGRAEAEGGCPHAPLSSLPTVEQQQPHLGQELIKNPGRLPAPSPFTWD